MKPRSIAENVAAFKSTRNPRFLARALWLVVRQGRSLELLYGGYCALMHPPMRVRGPLDETLRKAIAGFRSFDSATQTRARRHLVERFGAELAIDLLPLDFAGARETTIASVGDLLVIGEYGLGTAARLAVVGRETCVVEDHYQHLEGVRHVHLVQEHTTKGHLLVATGDSRKVLDLWALEAGRLRFVRRLKAHFGGHLTAVTIRGRTYLGTDFSCRPNYIETLCVRGAPERERDPHGLEATCGPWTCLAWPSA